MPKIGVSCFHDDGFARNIEITKIPNSSVSVCANGGAVHEDNDLGKNSSRAITTGYGTILRTRPPPPGP